MIRTTPEPAKKSTERAPAGPFARFAVYEAQDLAAVLGDGHPQLAAVLLAHLDPVMAADVLRELSPEARGEVVRRIGSLIVEGRELIRQLEAEEVEECRCHGE